jgi:hypothetical protein
MLGELGAFRDQIIGTAIPLFVVGAPVDARNRAAPKANLAPFVSRYLPAVEPDPTEVSTRAPYGNA